MIDFLDCVPSQHKDRTTPLLVPIFAANWEMAVLFEKHIRQYVSSQGGGKKTDYCRLLNYDAQYNVYWVEIQPNACCYTCLVEAGRECYYIWRDAYKSGLTDWQFPFLNPAYQSVMDWPYPPAPEEEVSGVIIALRGWGAEFNDIDELILDPMRDYHFNPDKETFGASLTKYGSSYKCNPPWSPEYDGIYIMTDYINPMRSSILFELGVQIAHAASLGRLSVEPYITELENTRLKPAIQRLKKLSEERPLLMREQWELEVYERLLIPNDLPEYDNDRSKYYHEVADLKKEVEEKTLDPVLREKLLNLIEDCYQLYIYI